MTTVSEDVAICFTGSEILATTRTDRIARSIAPEGLKIDGRKKVRGANFLRVFQDSIGNSNVSRGAG